MIKIKLGGLINSVEVLQRLAKMDFKAKLAWQISKLLTAAEKEIQEFNQTRMNLVTKYGEKDENGELVTDENGNCTIPPEVNVQFATEISELLNAEVELNVNPLNIDDLANADFTPSDMTILEQFFKTEEE